MVVVVEMKEELVVVWSFGEEEKNEGERRRKSIYRIWICEGDANKIKERGFL